jgi:ribonuclease HII
MDEVGRGAWAGPLLVGVVLVDAAVGPAPAGTRDSKLLARSAREGLLASLQAWCTAWSVGQASAREIDELGLTAALGIAANRAMAALPIAPDALIVDGPYDFVTARSAVADAVPSPRVTTRVGADASCSTVAAASVIAKVLRDRRMRELSAIHPGYGFDAHVGYGTTAHASAIADRGLCAEHRRTWSFAATGDDQPTGEDAPTMDAPPAP